MIYAVDFDGTLCESDFPNIGRPNRKLIKHLISLRESGDKLILWTSRSGDRLDEAVRWCEKQGITFDAVNANLPEIVEKFGTDPRKVYAHRYIDDKNMDDLFYKKYHIPYKEPESVVSVLAGKNK